MMRSLWMALHRDRPSHQLPCVLTSLFHIHISNQILCQEEIDLFNGPALNARAGVTGVDPITIRQSFDTELVTAAL